MWRQMRGVGGSAMCGGKDEGMKVKGKGVKGEGVEIG